MSDTSWGVILALIAVIQALIVGGMELFKMLLKRRGSGDEGGKGGDCRSCRENVAELLRITKDELKVLNEERIADLKQWADVARQGESRNRAAIRSLTKAVREGTGIDFEEEEVTEEEE